MSYEKDRNGWHEFSNKLEGNRHVPFFKEREIWWTSIGVNVGHEEDGKGDQYSRPVLVMKKFGKHTFVGIPLSTNNKIGKWYYNFSFVENIESTALLAHIKSFDSRRLVKKYGSVDVQIFEKIRKAAKDLL